MGESLQPPPPNSNNKNPCILNALHCWQTAHHCQHTSPALRSSAFLNRLVCWSRRGTWYALQREKMYLQSGLPWAPLDCTFTKPAERQNQLCWLRSYWTWLWCDWFPVWGSCSSLHKEPQGKMFSALLEAPTAFVLPWLAALLWFLLSSSPPSSGLHFFASPILNAVKH